LQIVSGSETLTWKSFITDVKYDWDLHNSVPARIQKQIDQKYLGGHKLQTLLDSHQDALCKDPRDKVYGFIGLASDTLEWFPMDYRKSLYEVWKDSVMFKNADTESSRHNIMQFGKLLQKILGGKGDCFRRRGFAGYEYPSRLLHLNRQTRWTAIAPFDTFNTWTSSWTNQLLRPALP
jgi:hypothetical protein